jgi:hypothetical protein
MDFVKKNPPIEIKKGQFPYLHLFVFLSVVFFLFTVILFLHTFTITIQIPIVLHDRTIKAPQINVASQSARFNLVQEAYAESPKTQDQKIADYIKSKDWDYDTAIRVAKSENAYLSRGHFDCEVTHKNNNGSIDYGLLQINSIHRVSVEAYFNEPFETAMSDCFKNIDEAYRIWQDSGWNPWVSYTGGWWKLQTTAI